MSLKAIPNVPVSKPNTLRRQILETRRAVKRLKKDARAAAKDIAERGASLTATRSDNTGAPHDVTISNPSLRTLRESEAAIVTLTRKLAALEREYESALQSAEAKADGASKYDF